MTGPILRNQSDVSAVIPMPTDRTDDASTVTAVTGETLTWFFLNSGAWTSATGEAAGTLVWGKTAFDGLLNSNKATVGSVNNTSIVFSAATRFDTLVGVPETVFSEIQFFSPTDQAAAMAKYLTTNGEYAIDHRHGQIWGLAKDTVADDTVAYSYKAPVAGGGGPTADVNLAQVAGTATAVGDGVMNAGTQRVAIASDQLGLIGGGVADGEGTYSTDLGDFTAVITDATNSIVLSTASLGGMTLTSANFANATLVVQQLIGATEYQAREITLDDFDWVSSTKTLDTANSTGAFTFNTGDLVSLTLKGPKKAYSTLNDANLSTLTRDLSDQETPETYTLTNVPNATPDETTLISMEGYRGCSIHIEKTGGVDTFTATIEGSNEGILSTDDWLDITQYGMENACGVDAASYTADTILSLKPGLKTKGLKVKITTAGAANDADFNLFVYRWF